MTITRLRRALSALLVASALPAVALAQNIAVSNVALTEGDAGTVNFDFPISLSAPAASAISLSYSTGAAGSATAGSDFVAVAAGVVTIAAGASAGTARVVVNSDLIVETQETFTVTIALQAGSPGTIVTDQALGQINNDDNAVLSLAALSQAEGNAPGSLSFTASLSRPVQGAVSARVTSSDDSALAPADYTSINQVLSFASSATTATFTVASVGDLIVEPNERFALSLSELTAAPLLLPALSLASGPVFATLNNDDNAVISISAPSQLEGNAGNSAMPFVLSLSAPVQGGLSLSASTADSTATTADLDYVARTGTVSFLTTAPQNFDVQIVGDTEVEPDQNFRVNLSTIVLPPGTPAAAVTLAAGFATGTIRNDDSTAISISAASILEGNSGSTDLVFNLTLSQPSKDPVTASFTAASGTAIVGTDFLATAGTVSFASNTTTQTVRVSVLGDLRLENDEDLTVILSNPVGATLAIASATGSIRNDDAVSLSIADARGLESSSPMNFAVTLTGVSDIPVAASFASANDSALAPGDYTATSGTVSFTPGVSLQQIPVVIISDSDTEQDERFFVRLSLPSPAATVTLSDASADGIIGNDDFVRAPTLSLFGALAMALLLIAVGGFGLRRG
jgi:hypothetical protein